MTSLAAESNPSAFRAPSRWWRIALGVGLIALIARLVFVAALASPGNEAGLNDNAGDARQYIALARNLAEFGTFIDDSTSSRPAGQTYYSLLRPPLYPLIVAPFEIHEWRTALFVMQAFIGCAIPMFAALLAGWWFHSRAGAWLAGLMAALSPTGIGLTGQVMADQLFSTLFAASIVAIACAARSPANRIRWLWSAGFACGLATLVKPAGLYWPLVLPFFAWIVFRAAASKLPWRHALVAVAIGLALPALWAARNYHVARVFAVSTVDAQNLRYYLAPEAQEWAKVDQMPGKGKLRRNREAAMRRDEADFGVVPPAQIVKRQWRESFEIFRAYPAETFSAYFHNIGNHFHTPFNGFDYQFPSGGIIRHMMGRLEGITGSTAAYFVIGILSFAALLRFERAWLLRVAALVIVFGYISGLSGTTYGTGSRILFPAHLAVQVMCAAGLTAIIRLSHRRVESIDGQSDSSSRPDPA